VETQNNWLKVATKYIKAFFNFAIMKIQLQVN